MYINPRILKNSDVLLLEYADEYGNFNIKEYEGKNAEVLTKSIALVS